MKSPNSTPYCRVPWTSVAVLPNGNVMPCVATHPESKGVMGNLKNQSFSQIWQSSAVQATRKFHLQPEGDTYSPCNLCFEIKSQGKTNRRDETEIKYGGELDRLDLDYSQVQNPQKIFLLDMAFSSVCNLTCTMCSSKYSTSWIDLDKTLQNKGFHRTDQATSNQGYENYWDNLKSIFPYLTELKYVLLKGGEPLLSKDCLLFLENLVEKKIAGQVTLKIISNGTIFNKKISELFKNFKEVEMIVSLDAMGPLYQYIRGGRKHNFAEVLQNIHRIRDVGSNVHLVASPTLQAYNAFQFPELIEFCFENSDELFFKNWVIQPSYQSVVALPSKLHEQVAKGLSQARHYLEKRDPQNKSLPFFQYMEDYLTNKIQWLAPHENPAEAHKKFVQYTRLMDEYREMKLAEIVPEVAPYLA